MSFYDYDLCTLKVDELDSIDLANVGSELSIFHPIRISIIMFIIL